MARSSTDATWTNLVDHVAWRVRDSGNIRKATLDLLSELDRNSKWGDVARSIPDGGPALSRFLNAVARRTKVYR